MGGLREVGYHPLCRQRAQLETMPTGQWAGHCQSRGGVGGCLTWHLQMGKGFDLALAVSGSADVGACVLGSD